MMTSIMGLSINALNISKKKWYEYDNVIMILHDENNSILFLWNGEQTS